MKHHRAEFAPALLAQLGNSRVNARGNGGFVLVGPARVRDDVHGGLDLARRPAQPALARKGFRIETVAVDVAGGE